MIKEVTKLLRTEREELFPSSVLKRAKLSFKHEVIIKIFQANKAAEGGVHRPTLKILLEEILK